STFEWVLAAAEGSGLGSPRHRPTPNWRAPMAATETLLIAGGTGTNGRVVLDKLVERGRTARALVRSAAKAADLRRPGVELVEGDLADPASLDAALRGVTRAFVVAPVGPKTVEWFANFFD